MPLPFPRRAGPGQHPRSRAARRDAGSRCGQDSAGRACCRSVQGCGLSADGNALPQHARQPSDTLGTAGSCKGPPSVPQRFVLEQNTLSGALFSGYVLSAAALREAGVALRGWFLLILEHPRCSSPQGVSGRTHFFLHTN